MLSSGQGSVVDINRLRADGTYRKAVNYKCQGTAAEILKMGMIKTWCKLHTKFPDPHFRPQLVLHLHDEVIYEVPDVQVEEFAVLLKETMENALKLRGDGSSSGPFSLVPLKVLVKAGPTWQDLKESRLQMNNPNK
jgi:DNA polymerase I-like protein with 3'-5' exonuclease and polymerase domains